MAITLQIGGVHFSTKLDLTAYVRQLIAKYPVGTRVIEEDKAFLKTLLQFHPDAERKLQDGIASIEVRLDKYGHKYFFMFDHHERGEEVSWTKCVSNAKAR